MEQLKKEAEKEFVKLAGFKDISNIGEIKSIIGFLHSQIDKAYQQGKKEAIEEIKKWADREKYDAIFHALDDSEEDDNRRDWCIDYEDLINYLNIICPNTTEKK